MNDAHITTEQSKKKYKLQQLLILLLVVSGIVLSILLDSMGPFVILVSIAIPWFFVLLVLMWWKHG